MRLKVHVVTAAEGGRQQPGGHRTARVEGGARRERSKVRRSE